MSLDVVFRRKESRRIFWIICCLLFIVLAGTRFYVLPRVDATLQVTGVAFLADITEKTLATVLVTVAIAFVIFWLIPTVDERNAITVLHQTDIGTALEEAILRADTWFYRGGTGRFLRAVTAPGIAKSARQKSSTKAIRIQLIDPDNKSACEHYARYRKGQASSASSPNSLADVRAEALATIYCLAQIAKAE